MRRIQHPRVWWEVHHGGYTPWVWWEVHHGGVYTSPWYMPGTPPWVYPHPTITPRCTVYRTRCTQCPAVTSWAPPGRNPWVRASQDVKIPKGVKEGGITLRVVTPAFLGELDERLDSSRVIPYVSPMRRGLCAEWSSVPPSDR